MTQQHFKDSCDINNIVAMFTATGIDPHAERKSKMQFGYASSQSFSEAMQNIAEINTAFAELPSQTRSDFSNDPARWLEHLATPPEPEAENIPQNGSQEPTPDPDPAPFETTNEGEIDST